MNTTLTNNCSLASPVLLPIITRSVTKISTENCTFFYNTVTEHNGHLVIVWCSGVTVFARLNFSLQHLELLFFRLKKLLGHLSTPESSQKGREAREMMSWMYVANVLQN